MKNVVAIFLVFLSSFVLIGCGADSCFEIKEPAPENAEYTPSSYYYWEELPIVITTNNGSYEEKIAEKYNELFETKLFVVDDDDANAVSITFGDTLHEGKVGYAFLDRIRGRHILKAHIIMDPEIDYNYGLVLSHELGHLLGFNKHTSVSGLMEAIAGGGTPEQMIYRDCEFSRFVISTYSVNVPSWYDEYCADYENDFADDFLTQLGEGLEGEGNDPNPQMPEPETETHGGIYSSGGLIF